MKYFTLGFLILALMLLIMACSQNKGINSDSEPSVGSENDFNLTVTFKPGISDDELTSDNVILGFDLYTASDYTLGILGPTGYEIISFNGWSGGGVVEILWNGLNADGDRVKDGIYIVEIEAVGEFDRKSFIMP